MFFVMQLPEFQRNLLFPSSGYQKYDDVGKIFLRNFAKCMPDYAVFVENVAICSSTAVETW
jgi:hypothetical protein